MQMTATLGPGQATCSRELCPGGKTAPGHHRNPVESQPLLWPEVRSKGARARTPVSHAAHPCRASVSASVLTS